MQLIYIYICPKKTIGLLVLSLLDLLTLYVILTMPAMIKRVLNFTYQEQICVRTIKPTFHYLSYFIQETVTTNSLFHTIQQFFKYFNLTCSILLPLTKMYIWLPLFTLTPSENYWFSNSLIKRLTYLLIN